MCWYRLIFDPKRTAGFWRIFTVLSHLVFFLGAQFTSFETSDWHLWSRLQIDLSYNTGWKPGWLGPIGLDETSGNLNALAPFWCSFIFPVKSPELDWWRWYPKNTHHSWNLLDTSPTRLVHIKNQGFMYPRLAWKNTKRHQSTNTVARKSNEWK